MKYFHLPVFRFVASCIFACQLFAMPALAQWSTNPNINNPISTAANNQYYPTIVSDGSGGAIITWQDYRSGTNYDIYAQRINSAGVVQWTADGVAISTAANEQSSPTITSDGSGGAIITWQDYRSGNYDIYAQRINSAGVVQWDSNGVAISTAADRQEIPTITSDGSGGAIITWQDDRNGNYDIYAQRINSVGVVQWDSNGVAIISTAANNQYSPTIVSDGSNGAIITWYDYRSGAADIYTQRINSAGVVQWDSNGVAISTAANDQLKLTIVSDGAGGANITWQDDRNGTNNKDIYAQRINSAGVVQWTTDGVAISTAAGRQEIPTIVSDGSGGAIITWYDNRSGTNADIYAQQVSANGQLGVVTGVQNDVAALPESFRLEQNYPNPFNPTTTISFALPSNSFVSLKVFDALGREVSLLLADELSAGTYARQWDAAGLASGVYFYRMTAGRVTLTKSMILMK
jgi:hypothetical protein